jgi:hypothetical protein
MTRGRIERSFDVLGLTVANKTIANFIEKASRLLRAKAQHGFGRYCA